MVKNHGQKGNIFNLKLEVKKTILDSYNMNKLEENIDKKFPPKTMRWNMFVKRYKIGQKQWIKVP